MWCKVSLGGGAKLIGMVKKNTKGLCKDTIENLTKDWPGDSYLVLRSNTMEPGDRTHIAIAYKYNARKVLSFIVTDNTGITKTGIPYLSKHTENLLMLPFPLLLVPLLCQNVFLLLMRLTPTKTQHSLIRHWGIGGLLSVVGCGYVPQLQRE